MKILMITHLVPFPLHGGVRLRNYNLLREASKRHEVHLVTFSQKAHQPDREALQRSIDAVRPYCQHLEVLEIPTDRSRLRWYVMLLLNLFSPTPYSAWRYYSRAMAAAISRLVDSHHYDLVECGTVSLAPLARLAGDVPNLLVHHNIESELLYRRARFTRGLASRLYVGLQAWKLRRFEKKVADRFAVHTTCSAEDAKLLNRFAPNARVVVVPNGVDTGYFTPLKMPQDAHSLVFVGSMGWFPNLDGMRYFASEVWPRLKQLIPDARASIIGSEAGPDLAALSRRDPNFQLLGFVDDIRPVVASANVFVVPLRVGGGTRLKIVEAMAMGKAIVSTSTGCEGIAVTHGKDIIIADEPKEMAAQIATVLRNADFRGELERNALRTAHQKYRWEQIGLELDEAYRRCASGRAPARSGP